MTQTCKISTIKQALGHFLSILLKMKLKGTTVTNYIYNSIKNEAKSV